MEEDDENDWSHVASLMYTSAHSQKDLRLEFSSFGLTLWTNIYIKSLLQPKLSVLEVFFEAMVRRH